MNLGSTPGVARGCGFRTEGGVYLETGVSMFGSQSIWRFVTDQPIPFEAPHTLGVDVVEHDGVFHVINHVGSKYWPEASDFIEEGIRYGFSTKIPKTLDLSPLTKASRLIHVHARGGVINPNLFGNWVDEPGHRTRCAQHRVQCFVPRDSAAAALAAPQIERERVMDGPAHPHVQNPGSLYPNGDGKYQTGCNAFQWFFAQPHQCTIRDANGITVEQFDADELKRIWNMDPGISPSIFLDFIHNPEYTVEFIRKGNKHGTNDYRVWPVFAAYPTHPAPQHVHCMIAALPITQVSVIEAADGSHQKTLAKKYDECSGKGGLYVSKQQA